MVRTRGGFVGRERPRLYTIFLTVNVLGAISLTIAALNFTLGAYQLDGRDHIPYWLLGGLHSLLERGKGN